jgi:hypothetical protein
MKHRVFWEDDVIVRRDGKEAFLAYFKVKSCIPFEIMKKYTYMEISVWTAGSPSNVLTI